METAVDLDIRYNERNIADQALLNPWITDQSISKNTRQRIAKIDRKEIIVDAQSLVKQISSHRQSH